MKKWIVLIAFLSVAMIINIKYAVTLDNLYANLFTAISGWISGLATLGIGVIAYLQNKKYEKDNKFYLDKQKKIQEKISLENQKQNEFMIRDRVYHEIGRHCEIIKADHKKFISDLNPYDFTTNLQRLYYDAKNDFRQVEDQVFNDVYENYKSEIYSIKIEIAMFQYANNYKLDVLYAFEEYMECLKEIKEDIKHLFSTGNNNECIDRLDNSYMNLANYMNFYVMDINFYFNYVGNESNLYDEVKNSWENARSRNIEVLAKIGGYLAKKELKDGDTE